MYIYHHKTTYTVWFQQCSETESPSTANTGGSIVPSSEDNWGWSTGKSKGVTWRSINAFAWLIYNLVRVLTVPMHLGRNWRALCYKGIWWSEVIATLILNLNFTPQPLYPYEINRNIIWLNNPFFNLWLPSSFNYWVTRCNVMSL